LLIWFEIRILFIFKVSDSSWKIEIAVNTTFPYISACLRYSIFLLIIIWLVIDTHFDGFTLHTNYAARVSSVGYNQFIWCNQTYISSTASLTIFISVRINTFFNGLNFLPSLWCLEKFIHFQESFDKWLFVILFNIIAIF